MSIIINEDWSYWLPRGVMLIDNVLWSGEVLKHPAPDGATEVLQDLNRVVAAGPRVTSVLVTLRDGVLVVRYRNEGLKQATMDT